jgi:hypothetical protein
MMEKLECDGRGMKGIIEGEHSWKSFYKGKKTITPRHGKVVC